MRHSEQHFRWTWELKAPPEALWPLVSDTDRFNRDCGYPAVTVIPPGNLAASRTEAAEGNDRLSSRLTNARRLRVNAGGVIVEWDEFAFEWVAPQRYAVERIYYRGPVARMLMTCELRPRADGGTTLIYFMALTPANLFGRLALPLVIGRKAKATTERVFRRYDEFALQGMKVSQLAQKSSFASGGAARLAAIQRSLVDEAGQTEPLVAQLGNLLRSADDHAAARLRPYVLADQWHADRNETLKLFLHATRAGLLDFSWDLICPHCRGAKAAKPSLAGVSTGAHCDSCNIDFTANFDQSIELTFTPNAAIRPVVRADYCVGGPQVTPHIIAQQTLAPGEARTLPLALQPGRYRVRMPGLARQYAFRVEPTGARTVQIHLGTSPLAEEIVTSDGELTITNTTTSEHLAIVEHVAWSNQATTAAEVTSLQLFRDLFSREVMRPGEQISVGSLTVVFTDLKNSTQLYKEIGDAPAFGRVLTHFEILKAAVAAENGAIVKTMGDAIMAVFPQPLAALRAMLHAQQWLASPQDRPLPRGVSVPASSLRPLALKASLNCGPCLAINQNERLDYFGTTVNLGARLCSLCTGTDLVLSQAVLRDAEISAWLSAPGRSVKVTKEEARLKGFGDETFVITRVQSTDAISSPPF